MISEAFPILVSANSTFPNSLLHMNYWFSISLSHSKSSRSQKANGSPAWLMSGPQRNHQGLSRWRRMKTHLLIDQSFSLYKNLWLLRTIPQGGNCICTPVCPFHPDHNHPTTSDSFASLSIKCVWKKGQKTASTSSLLCFLPHRKRLMMAAQAEIWKGKTWQIWWVKINPRLLKWCRCNTSYHLQLLL